MYDDLIQAVYEYVGASGIDSFDNIALIKHSTDIFLNERDFNFNHKFKKGYGFNYVDNLVSSFLSDLNPSYLDYYNTRKNDGSFVFEHDGYGDAYSTYDDENNHHVIFISLTNTIQDAFAIVHELFHDLNLRVEIDSYGRYFFTECLSILGEFLLSDYLVEKNIFEARDVVNYILFCLRRKALDVNFNLRLIEKYFEKGFLNDKCINDIVNSYPLEYRDFICEVMYVISSQNWLTLEEEECYILSGLSATYMYDRIKNNKKYMNELFDLNEVLNDFDLSQVLNYLDLEHGSCELTFDGYDILHKSYKKFIKR